MARKKKVKKTKKAKKAKSKKKKAVKRGRPRGSRAAVKIDSKAIGKAVAAALAPVVTELKKKDAIPVASESKPDKQYYNVGCDQRHTKNLGNYESFVYGFALSLPVAVEEGDDFSTQETRDRLRGKYEQSAQFLKGMLDETRREIDAAMSSSV